MLFTEGARIKPHNPPSGILSEILENLMKYLAPFAPIIGWVNKKKKNYCTCYNEPEIRLILFFFSLTNWGQWFIRCVRNHGEWSLRGTIKFLWSAINFFHSVIEILIVTSINVFFFCYMSANSFVMGILAESSCFSLKICASRFHNCKHFHHFFDPQEYYENC